MKELHAKITTCTLAVLFLVIAGLCWFRTPDAYSESERRELADFPELNKTSLVTGSFMDEFETYALDQFPFRDTFRSLKAFSSFYLLRQKDNHDIYIADGYAAKMEYPLNDDMISYASKTFQGIYEKFLKDTDTNLYISVVPDKNYFLGKESGHLSYDYEEMVSMLKENLNEFKYIDIFPTLSLSDYYKTDTHWKQETLFDTAGLILGEMNSGISVDFTDSEVSVLDHPFYGVYYGQAALPLAPDTLRYVTLPSMKHCTVTYNEGFGEEVMDFYDMEKAYGKDPYEMFLAGTKALVTIENPEAVSDKELVIFRDSFGSSLAPLFTDYYQKITLVDLRYLSGSMVGNFVEFKNQDVLFLYSTLILNNSLALKP